MTNRLVQQRKQIAQDVIAKLDTEKIIASSGMYMRVEGADEEYTALHEDFYYGNVDNQAYKTPKQCRVCEIGALFVASVDRYNKLTLADASADNDGDVGDGAMLTHLNRWWNAPELRLIEVAFEGSMVTSYDHDWFDGDDNAMARYRAQVRKARMWHTRRKQEADARHLDNADYIMRAICKKLVRSTDATFRL